MKLEKVSRKDLRSIAPGKTVLFELPTPQKCASARVTVCYMNAYENTNLTVKVNPEARTVMVTRLIPQKDGQETAE